MAKSRAKLTRNFSFVDILQRPSANEMRQLGTEIRDRIEDRTRRGLDEENRAFRPYKGGLYKGKAIPDLYDSGRMLNDLQVTKAEPGTVEIGFISTASEDVARFHMGGTRHLPPRRFLGIAAHWIEDIRRWFADRIVKEHAGMPSRARGGRR